MSTSSRCSRFPPPSPVYLLSPSKQGCKTLCCQSMKLATQAGQRTKKGACLHRTCLGNVGELDVDTKPLACLHDSLSVSENQPDAASGRARTHTHTNHTHTHARARARAHKATSAVETKITHSVVTTNGRGHYITYDSETSARIPSMSNRMVEILASPWPCCCWFACARCCCLRLLRR